MTYWRERAAETARLRDRLAAAPRVELHARLAAELELGLLRCLLGEPAAGPLAMAMDCGAALALARVAARRGDGFRVELRWPAAGGGEDFVRLPAADNGFGWPDWLDAFALALRDDR